MREANKNLALDATAKTVDPLALSPSDYFNDPANVVTAARQAGAKPRNSGSTTTRTRKTKRRSGGLMSFFRG